MTYILINLTDPVTGDIRYTDEHGNDIDVNICTILNSCEIGSSDRDWENICHYEYNLKKFE